jgi:hypothetical protein
MAASQDKGQRTAAGTASHTHSVCLAQECSVGLPAVAVLTVLLPLLTISLQLCLVFLQAGRSLQVQPAALPGRHGATACHSGPAAPPACHQSTQLTARKPATLAENSSGSSCKQSQQQRQLSQTGAPAAGRAALQAQQAVLRTAAHTPAVDTFGCSCATWKVLHSRWWKISARNGVLAYTSTRGQLQWLM